jgi:hypothetical protein
MNGQYHAQSSLSEMLQEIQIKELGKYGSLHIPEVGSEAAEE